MTELRIENPDDDHLEVYVGDELIASANHDEHGWSGMDAVEKTARAVERALRAEVEWLRNELNAIGDLAYRADPADGEDALLVIQARAKRAAGGA